MKFMYEGVGVKRLESMKALSFSQMGPGAREQVWEMARSFLEAKNLWGSDQVRAFGAVTFVNGPHGPKGYECRIVVPGYVKADESVPRVMVGGGLYAALRVLHPAYFGAEAIDRAWRLLHTWVSDAKIEVPEDRRHELFDLEEYSMRDGVGYLTLYVPINRDKFLGKAQEERPPVLQKEKKEFQLKLRLDDEFPEEEDLGKTRIYRRDEIDAASVKKRFETALSNIEIDNAGMDGDEDMKISPAAPALFQNADVSEEDKGKREMARDVTMRQAIPAPFSDRVGTKEENTPQKESSAEEKSRMIFNISNRIADAIEKEEHPDGQ